MPCGSCSSDEASVFCNRCCGYFCNVCKEKDFLCVGAVTNHIDVSRCIVYLMKQIDFYENCLQNNKTILSEIKEKHNIDTFVSTPVINTWTDEDEAEAVKIAQERSYQQTTYGFMTPGPYQGNTDYIYIYHQCLQDARRLVQQRKKTETWTKVDTK